MKEKIWGLRKSERRLKLLKGFTVNKLKTIDKSIKNDGMIDESYKPKLS